MFRLVFLQLFLIFGFISFAQPKDDLLLWAQKVVKSNLFNENKIDSLNSLANALVKQNHQKASKILSLTEGILKEAKYQNGEGTVLYIKAKIEELYGSIDKASDLNLKALALIKDSTTRSNAYVFQGWLYRRLNLKEKGIEYTLRGVKLAEALKNYTLLGNGYNSIAILYVEQEDYKKANDYHQQALKYRKLSGDKVSVGMSFGNLGIVAMREGKYQDAINYHQQALEIFTELKDDSEIAFTYNDLGATYSSKGDQPNAIKYLIESIRLREAMQETSELAYTYNYLGEAYQKSGNIKQAELWIKKALQQAIAIKNTKQQVEALESVSNFYAAVGKTDSAFKYLKLYKYYADSLKKIDRVLAIDELTTRFETEKKEQEILLLNKQKDIQKLEIQSKNFLLIISVFLIFVIVLGSMLVINRRRAKEKLNLQQEIIKQQDLATNAILQAEEKERRRISSDLHDGVGQMLSASLLNLNDFYLGIKDKLSSPENEKALLSIDLVNDTYDEVRNVSHQMMPNALLKSGLAAGVREFLSKIENDHLKVVLDISGLDEKLNEQVETVVYRIIQECVNNIIKHANANKITIQIINEFDGITFTVEDNGIGFDNSQTSNGIGLSNIYSRVTFLKGEVSIDSKVNNGTLIHVFIPKLNS